MVGSEGGGGGGGRGNIFFPEQNTISYSSVCPSFLDSI